jgi:hypothetical protein
MEELCAEGLATHGDPKPCVDIREDEGEASAGAHAGRVLSREIDVVRSADVVLPSGRQTWPRARVRASWLTLRGREDPSHAWNLYAREPGERLGQITNVL